MRMSYELNDSGYFLTKHAVQQAQKRGIKWEIIDFIICYADKALYAGAGCLTIRISLRENYRLQMEGMSSTLLDKSKNVVLIASSFEPIVITVMHDHGSNRGRCYRKQMPTKSKKRAWSQRAERHPGDLALI